MGYYLKPGISFAIILKLFFFVDVNFYIYYNLK